MSRPIEVADPDPLWPAHESGLWLAQTADRFGLPPILVGRPGDAAFASHRPRARRPPLAALQRTIRTWEGDPRGTWPISELSSIRQPHARLLAELAALSHDPSEIQ